MDERTGCWIWQLRLDRAGYGRITRGGKVLLAHRWFYEQEHGPIPRGAPLDHVCRMRACVNPAHLELVTTTENNRRSSATKLTQADVAAIRASSDSDVELAGRLGVDRSNIAHIRAGRSWAEASVA